MGKVAIAYTDVFGNAYAVLQESTVQVALGNTLATAGTPRLPRKIKPRKVGVRFGGSSPYTYGHYVVSDEATLAGLTIGSAITGLPPGAGTVAGADDERNNGYASF